MNVPLRNEYSKNPLRKRGTYHRLIFWRVEALLLRMPSQNFARDRIVVPKVSVLDILLRQLVFNWHLVSEYGETNKKTNK